MALVEVTKLINDFNDKSQIVSMESYNKGYGAGCSIQSKDVINELTTVYSERETLGDDYCMGLIDGALTVIESTIDLIGKQKDNCAA